MCPTNRFAFGHATRGAVLDGDGIVQGASWTRPGRFCSVGDGEIFSELRIGLFTYCADRKGRNRIVGCTRRT